jgi:hypothetical protein
MFSILNDKLLCVIYVSIQVNIGISPLFTS